MQFVQPTPFYEAIDKLGSKSPIGAMLSSSEWSDVPVALRERAFFSANVENVRFLDRAQGTLGDFLTGARETLPDGQTVLRSGSRAAFIQQLREFAMREGMGPLDPEDAGTLQDITSERRLGLIFDTMTTSAGSYGYFRQGLDPDVLNEFPGVRFIRVKSVREPRLNHMQFEGQIFLKGDPALARINVDFGVPWAPFGWGCGHDVEDADRKECEAAGLLKPGERYSVDPKNFNENLQASALNLPAELLQKLHQVFGNKIEIANDVIRWASPQPSSGLRSPSSAPAGEGSENQSPVSAALELQVHGSTREAVKTALAAIDKVHDDGALPVIPVQSGATDNAFGVFEAARTMDGMLLATRIGIAPRGSWPALTAVHEIGHFLDAKAIGPEHQFATLTNYEPMRAVLVAAHLTDAIAQIERRSYQGTLLEPEEIWARAYAQYIAEKSGNATLLADLQRVRERDPARQWATEDFKPIATAIETMFNELGWL